MAIAPQLFQLDQLDADLERREAALNEVRRQIRRDPEAEALQAKLDAARERSTQASARQRRLESDLADIEGRIKRDNTRMYSGQIVDSRELASLEREITHHRATRDTVENELLAVMEQAESLQDTVANLSRQANEMRERRETDRPALVQQAEEMSDALAGLRAERETLAAALDPRTLTTYERLRKASGHAVSRVSGGVCQWCRVTIPPKDVQHARGGAMVTCSNCGRILFAG